MRRRRRSVAPIYTFALVWLLFTLFVPLLKFAAFVVCLALAFGSAAAADVYLRQKRREKEETEASAAEPVTEEKAEEDDTAKYPPEVAEVLREGRTAMREFGRLYGTIRSESVRAKINEIMEVTDKITRDAIDDNSDVPEINKFLNFYVPTTIKLLNAYDRMDAQGIEGEHITGSKQSIEEMLDTTIDAYKKQLDMLFANQALDIDADIRAITGMMAREGLTGDSYLDWNEFMKKYEKENKMKGTTQNG